ncbi:Myb-like DNA-binding domain containing protein [Histomonas meleagridis]|uniref:Myb-like DNA-binding domain containing protein n=1 Tax=Histomonas meleagridis TaxID=135588 RepID=UPI00355A0CD9|nr:Myb-like DNA-binding domain containing protein [Histomonas meleagridis]KAH0797107.1 Myb-like DNA-binding domain containing protein [Histomonas meleagridis]
MTVEETSFPNNNKSLYNSTEKRKRPWSHVEDNRLIAAVNKLGMTDWEAIARFVGNGRSRPQCSQRWKRALDPRITKEPWTPAEEQKLIELVREHGAKGWGKISLMMGSRSDLQCRYRYEQIKRQRGDAFKYSSLPFFNSIYGFSRIYNNSGKLQFSDKEQNIIPQQYSIQELLSKPNNNEHKKLDSIACILSKAELESLQMNVQVKQCVQ